MKRIVFIASFLVILLGCFGLMADVYEEQFTNTTFRDDEGTTAEWGTQVDGKATPGLGPRVVHSATAGGSTKAVATNGKYVFCASSNITGAGGGLYVFDGETYALKGSFVTNQDEVGVAVGGKFAYLVRSSGNITIVDIGNLSAMSSPGGITGLSSGGKADYAHGFVYVAAGTYGFYAVNLETNTATQISAYTGSPDARNVKIWGRYLLVADDAGLFVFSLDTPGTPTSVGSIAIADCRDVDTDGYMAFVASDDNLRLVNLSDPTSPALITSISAPGEANAIAFAGGFTVACYGDEGIKVHDYRDFTTYKYSGKIPFSGDESAEDAVTIGKQTAVATGDDGSVAFISNAHKFAPSGDWGDEVVLSGYGAGETVDIIINGRYAYATVQTFGLITIDLTTMSVVDTDEISGGSSLGMALAGDRLLVAGGNAGLKIFNITTPSNPTISATETFDDGIVYHVVADGKFGYAALGGDNKGVARFDIFTPSSFVVM
ncbi:MAG TPA: hypothetical protein ENN07_07250, partial [candidate division Zixibacteria bacterium]|nr:hypothetical protein [candidate division Zixibacteria bacterium]